MTRRHGLTLFDFTLALVCYWCLRAGADKDEIPDFVQQVFVKVSDNIRRFRHSKFRGWLRTITINTVRDCQRKNQLERSAFGGTDAWKVIENQATYELSEEENQSELQRLVRSAMQQVQASSNAKHWKAFWMRTIECKPAKEISEEIGISIDAVYQAKSRILVALRKELANANVEIE